MCNSDVNVLCSVALLIIAEISGSKEQEASSRHSIEEQRLWSRLNEAEQFRFGTTSTLVDRHAAVQVLQAVATDAKASKTATDVYGAALFQLGEMYEKVGHCIQLKHNIILPNIL
jgi:hypothetical protein